jgi:TetR/AcrR family transcriptional regulator, cholesterol catabolism regulator
MDQRRQLILAAAAELFSELGYEQATVEAVGERVGLSKPSLYYYVSSKEDLLAQLLVEVIEVMEREIAALDGADDPTARLLAFFTGHVRVVCTNPSGRLLATHEHLVLGGASGELMRETRRRHTQHLESILRTGIASGAFRQADVRVIAWSALAALNDVARWWSPAGSASPEDVAKELHTLFVQGLRA